MRRPTACGTLDAACCELSHTTGKSVRHRCHIGRVAEVAAVHLVDYLALRALTLRRDLAGAHAPLPAELRALRDELDVHERGGAGRACSCASSTRSPSTTTPRSSRSRAARRSCGPTSCAGPRRARARSSAADGGAVGHVLGQERSGSRRRSSARSTCSTTSPCSLDVFHEREVAREDVYRVLDSCSSRARTSACTSSA